MCIDVLNHYRLKYLLNVPDHLEASATTMLQWAKVRTPFKLALGAKQNR